MGYIAGIGREQLILFPENLDDYISADNPVRFIDAWVDTLDLTSLGFSETIPAETGRPLLGGSADPERLGQGCMRN